VCSSDLAESLPRTLSALLAQDYPGIHEVILVDDRSTDGTADVARRIAAETGHAAKLRVVTGAPLPEGWVGKVWALEQAMQNVECKMQNGQPAEAVSNCRRPIANSQQPIANNPAFFLLTDADILHAPSSLRRLVAESVCGASFQPARGQDGRTTMLALNSRMARLRCESPAERLLIPAFVFFFNLLYPMRRVNDPRDSVAGAAGGCMLLSAEALAKIGGGFACIRGEIIDDCALARQVKDAGLPIRLSLSRAEVHSLRAYPKLADIWRMVSRSAFTELKHSWLRLAIAIAGLALLFAAPLLAVCGGLASAACSGGAGDIAMTGLWASVKGLLALGTMAYVYGPAVRFFELPRGYVWSLPLAGMLYGLMTLDSAWRHARGTGTQWRETTV
jgi:hopene-associated glycosyltransferase HpnB